MALLDMLRELVESDEDARRRVDDQLKGLHRSYHERALRLEATAGQAPSSATESDLRRLASDHRRLADLVGTALEARAASLPAAPESASSAEGHNHWARIVDDLAVFQAGRNQTLELGNAIVERHPELTELFDVLTRKCDEHVTRLRGEIARADPQALN